MLMDWCTAIFVFTSISPDWACQWLTSSLFRNPWFVSIDKFWNKNIAEAVQFEKGGQMSHISNMDQLLITDVGLKEGSHTLSHI
uniref:Uncharacterized protein n=1 Tax=Arion vulgaris TaxID=1028688 RepID=A0A0B7AQI2_9EUPU